MDSKPHHFYCLHLWTGNFFLNKPRLLGWDLKWESGLRCPAIMKNEGHAAKSHWTPKLVESKNPWCFFKVRSGYWTSQVCRSGKKLKNFSAKSSGWVNTSVLTCGGSVHLSKYQLWALIAKLFSFIDASSEHRSEPEQKLIIFEATSHSSELTNPQIKVWEFIIY